MDTKSLLDDQLKSDREYRRRSQGFVTPVQALNFLNATKKSTQDQLIMQVAYDLDARRYFETRRQKQSGQVAEPSRVPENRALSHENDTASNAKESLKGTKVDPNGLNELESLMDQLGEFEPKTEQRLKIESSQKSPNRIRRELAALSISHPREFDERQNEVLYLSNILMSGTGVQGGRFTDEEAAKAVLATCNLGLECLLDSAPEDEVELLGECLMDEPGLIRVFQIGYKKISEIPQRAVTGIIQALTGRRLERRIQSQPWIRDQISEQFGRSKLHEPVDEATFSHMQKMIRLLSQICDPQSCQVLIPLVDSFPAFPTYLDPMHKADIHVVKSKRYYQTPSEIDQVDRFLNSLETLL